MGLLDALFSNDSGGGMLGSLPQSWQWQNPADEVRQNQQPQPIAYDPMGNVISGGAPSNYDPFGPLPQSAPQPVRPSIFATGTAGLANNGPSGPIPGMFAPQAAPPQNAPAPIAAPAPQIEQPPGPINNMDIGGYSMPQFGTAADYTPQRAVPQSAPSTDISSQSRQPAALPMPAAFGQQSEGPGGNALAGLQSFLNGGGLISSIRGAMNGGQRSDPVGIQQQNQRAQYQALGAALIQSGKTPQEASQLAMFALTNPEAAKTVISEALTNKEKWGEIGSDSFGNKTMGWINERNQTINGKEMGADAGANGGGAASGFMAPGVKSVDSSLTGKDYLKQFSPEVQAAVENYVQGKSMPTGNPRKGFTQAVKMIAQKYGEDTGQSVDDATYGARRTMRNQLSSSAPSSLGGQINIGNTAAGHLADLTQKAIELGNVDTGIAPLTALVNNTRGLGTEQAAKMEALKGAAQHYGQEITKFYAGSPGGVAERDRFIESVNGARSPKELAAILSTEAELMRSRLDALGGQIKGVLGEEGMKQYPVLRPDGEAALAKVQENVAKLKGGAAAASTAGPMEGRTATNPQTGQTLTFRNGKWQ